MCIYIYIYIYIQTTHHDAKVGPNNNDNYTTTTNNNDDHNSLLVAGWIPFWDRPLNSKLLVVGAYQG